LQALWKLVFPQWIPLVLSETPVHQAPFVPGGAAEHPYIAGKLALPQLTYLPLAYGFAQPSGELITIGESRVALAGIRPKFRWPCK